MREGTILIYSYLPPDAGRRACLRHAAGFARNRASVAILLNG